MIRKVVGLPPSIPSRGDNTCSDWGKYGEHKTDLEVEMREKE